MEGKTDQIAFSTTTWYNNLYSIPTRMLKLVCKNRKHFVCIQPQLHPGGPKINIGLRDKISLNKKFGYY
jgi:hypothetical protein